MSQRMCSVTRSLEKRTVVPKRWPWFWALRARSPSKCCRNTEPAAAQLQGQSWAFHCWTAICPGVASDTGLTGLSRCGPIVAAASTCSVINTQQLGGQRQSNCSSEGTEVQGAHLGSLSNPPPKDGKLRQEGRQVRRAGKQGQHLNNCKGPGTSPATLIRPHVY